MTSSIPAAVATASAVAALSPVSRTGRRPRVRKRLTAAGAEGFTVSVTARAPRIWSSQLTSTVVQPAFFLGTAPAGEAGSDLDAEVGEQLGAAEDDLVAFDNAAGA